MLCQAVDTTEGLAAVIAVEGQLACVHPPVLEKFLAVQEIPAARLARKGLFRGVKLLMSKEVGVGFEGLPTLLTIKGLFSAVHPQVLTKACVLLKPFPAFLTLKRLSLPLHWLPLFQSIFQRPTGARLGLSSHSCMAFPVLIKF